jgi:hypothetical protein
MTRSSHRAAELPGEATRLGSVPRSPRSGRRRPLDPSTSSRSPPEPDKHPSRTANQQRHCIAAAMPLLEGFQIVSCS